MRALYSLCILWFALGGGPAAGAIVFDNGAPSNTRVYASDSDFPQQAGDNFAFDSPVVLADAHWWGTYLYDATPPAVDVFTLRIFAMSAGVPAVTPLHEVALPSVARTFLGGGIGVYDLYAYDAAFSPIALAPGEYLFSVVADTLNEADDWFWAGITTAGDGGVFGRPGDGQTWSPGPFDLAFQLSDDGRGVIPEPATMGLLALGGLGLVRRRRRKS